MELSMVYQAGKLTTGRWLGFKQVDSLGQMS
jgi:hypothetical protein